MTKRRSKRHTPKPTVPDDAEPAVIQLLMTLKGISFDAR